MSKSEQPARFACHQCGASFHKWRGRCDRCHEWGTVSEEIARSDTLLSSSSQPNSRTRSTLSKSGSALLKNGLPLTTVGLTGISEQSVSRTPVGIHEVDRVLGGGLVHGSVVLLGGDPGIGKSTLTLQVAAQLSVSGGCLYVSGEEAEEQIQHRAQRLGVAEAPLLLAHSNNVANIFSTVNSLSEKNPIKHIVIDSVQTMVSPTIDAAAGTVSQVRACAHALATVMKERGICLWLISHMTKDGQLAGPKVVEHLVDVVLHLEGERANPFRVLRSTKNRYGSTSEVGVFEMNPQGLCEVPDPSALFLDQRNQETPGTVLFCAIEGSRPVLLEIQVLVVPTSYSIPKRSTLGCDKNRLEMLLAVIEAHCGLSYGSHDVYLNVVGGLRINEPAMDLASVLAIVSATTGIAFSHKAAAFGEIGLTGEIRNATSLHSRLNEAQRMGVTEIWMAQPLESNSQSAIPKHDALALHTARHISDLKSPRWKHRLSSSSHHNTQRSAIINTPQNEQ